MLDMRRIGRFTLVAVFVAAIGIPSPDSADAGPRGPMGAMGNKSGDDLPKFDEVTKDMEVREGFFTLYYDKKKDTLLGRIPSSMLEEPFLLSISIPKGPMLAGWMVGSDAVYWERHNDKLLLMSCETRYKEGKGSTLEDVIGRTYTDRIIMALDIKTEAPGGDPVIDLGDLMKTDMVGLGRMYGGRSMDRSLSQWNTRKAFPLNVELSVDAALMGRSGGIIAATHFSMSKLPKNDYKPREADERVGYFLTAKKDWTTEHTAKTVFKRYIHRWHLEKEDPDAEVSPVKNPIVFYIEKTVPIPFRRWVREGILEWNKAFEKIGLLSAVQVRQQTETNEFKDLDPEDVRYNFIRWIVTGTPFARGPSHVNPFTGQILDADIVFDDSMLRYYMHDYELMGPRGYESLSDPLADRFYERFPVFEHTPLARVLTPEFNSGTHLYSAQDVPDTERLSDLAETFHAPMGHGCELATGMAQQLAFAQLLHAGADGRKVPEEFIGQVLKETVMHEVGHTLGLRHNFKASSWLPMSEITSPNKQERPLTASVMDYNPLEYAEEQQEQGSFITRTLGPYDYWAIEYGYKPFKANGEQKTEADMLKAIASRAAEDGLAYATDEDTSLFGPDPYVNRFDNGQDPLEFAKHRMKMVDWLMDDLDERAVEEGESYFRLRRAFNITLAEYGLASSFAARMVGGQSVSRTHKGDPNAPDPFVIVPAAEQREALSFLAETIFSDEAFDFSPELLNKLAPGRFWHWDSDQLNFDIAYDVHDRVLAYQSRVLAQLINPVVTTRIYDAELKVPKDEEALTVDEVFSRLNETIWSELDQAGADGDWTNRKPMASSFRRNLQRRHLSWLTEILLRGPEMGYNADTHAVVRMSLESLGERIGNALEKSKQNLDTYTLAHLDDSKNRIKRALDAEFTDGASR